MLISSLRVWSCAFLVTAGFLSGARAQVGNSVAPGGVREAAVAEAKAGDPKGGLTVLRSLLERYPNDPRLLADTVIVANLAGADTLALELYARPNTPKQDAGVAEAAARAARNLHQYDRATLLYRRSEALAPERWQPRLGEAMVQVDEGRYSRARLLMQSLPSSSRQEKDVLAGQEYLCRREGNFACMLSIEEGQLQKRPDDPLAQCQFARTLSQAGGETRARELCRSADSQNGLALGATAGAEEVRWGESFALSRKLQQAETEQGLARLEVVIAASPSGGALWRQAQFDRLVALVDLWRMRDAVLSYEKLQRENISVPFYAELPVASAYLAIHEPRKAEILYRRLLHRFPEDGAAWSGLAYALLESEHIAEAFQTIDHAYSKSPSWLQSPGLKIPQSNRIHQNLGLQAAEFRGYAGMYKEQQRRVGALLVQAPAAAELGRAMAMTYLDRGWPRLAMAQERISDSYVEKDELPSRQELEIDENAGYRDVVDTELPALLAREGMSPPVQLFLRDRAIERGWQFASEGTYEWASGRFLGSTDEQTESHLDTPLLDNRWRVFGHELNQSGTFLEGNAVRTRGGLGLSYSYARQFAFAELAIDTGTKGTTPAANLGTQLRFGDHWAFDATADTDSMMDVQLIAVLAKVHARSLDMGLDWRASELRAAGIGVQRVLFSDGNQRAALSGKYDQRVWTSPRWKINVAPEEWASSNSKNENRLYFNPRHDFSIGPRGTVDWLTWRHYDRSLHQEVTFYSAPYWQQNYGTGLAFAAGFAQRWNLNARVVLVDGVLFDSQPYDGVNETYTAVNLGLTWGHK